MKKKIWILDDDLSILEVVKIVLEEEGYDVLTISNPNFLDQRIKKEIPDLIFLDVWVSDKNGQEIAKKLKAAKATKNLPVIITSALTSCKEIARDSGADDFLRKPFDMGELIDIVRKYTDKNLKPACRLPAGRQGKARSQI